MEPSKANIQKWCEALRSGKYQQTRAQLQGHNGHCCLGVACELFISPEQQERDDWGLLTGGFPFAQSSAPGWLDNINHEFKENTGTALVCLNDELQLTFDEIADVLEAVYILEVFK